MKESVFDVLIYLFENYMSDEPEEVELEQDREALKYELLEAGFQRSSIGKAFEWLEALSDFQEQPERRIHVASPSFRVYSEQESEKLGPECRGFLLFLEQMGVLDHSTREMVVDRVMALDDSDVDLDQLKWVILMVLFNQPGSEEAFAWMEDLVLDEATSVLH